MERGDEREKKKERKGGVIQRGGREREMERERDIQDKALYTKMIFPKYLLYSTRGTLHYSVPLSSLFKKKRKKRRKGPQPINKNNIPHHPPPPTPAKNNNNPTTFQYFLNCNIYITSLKYMFLH